jgi:tetratricopeptide (TPR) repeat protein
MAVHARAFAAAKAISMKRGVRLLAIAVAAGAMLWCAVPVKADNGGVDFSMPDIGVSSISDPRVAMQYARQRILAHDLQGAVFALQHYLLNHPEESGVRSFLGSLYLSDGDVNDAESLYKQMLDDFPLDNNLHSDLGRVYMVENRTDDAIAQFDKSLPDVESIYYLVVLHERKGDLPAFTRQMRELAQRQPSDATIQLEAGQLFGALYLPRDAATDFQRALAIDPNSLSALDGLGLAQTAIGENAAAEATLERCLALDPQSYGCLDALGLLYLQESRNDQALATLSRAHDLAPEEPQALIGLARVVEARSDWNDAIAYYERALYVWPYSSDAYVGIAFDQEELGELAQAEQTTLKGLAIAPDDARLHYMLGYIYRKLGKRDLALAQFLVAERSLDPDVARFAKESASALQQP